MRNLFRHSGRVSDRGRRVRLQLEVLEDRNLLSTVHALFDLSTSASGPFPSDRFTVPDPNNLTGLRIHLPLPDPVTQKSDYQDTQVINTLDGFNVQPRLSISFDGAIDPSSTSVNSSDVFLISLGDTVPGGDKGGERVGINQVVWDPATNTLHVESDQLLDQHTRYVLIVTNGVKDTNGDSVQASAAFTGFLHSLNHGQTGNSGQTGYPNELRDALAAAIQDGVPESNIVTASVFTTQSVTAVLEKIRDQIDAAPAPAPANFNIGLNGQRTVFNMNNVKGITFNEQTGVNSDGTPSFTVVNLGNQVFPKLNVIPGAVAQVAYGEYISPDFEVHPGEYIPAVGTLTGTPAVQGYNHIYFTLFLPSGPMPDTGWPVAIVGHGGGDSKDGAVSGVAAIAATMAAQGIATIEINTVGHGFGPLSTLTITQADSSTVTLPSGGRGIDQNGDGKIEAAEGFTTDVNSPQAIIASRDGRIQTAADLMQLVRVIESGGGMTVPLPDGTSSHLDPARIYYAGASLSSWFGAPFLAVEPDVKVGMLNTVGGPELERRLGNNRSGAPTSLLSLASILANREPQLINSPGITSLDGVKVVAPPYFNENMPLRSVTLPDGTIQPTPLTVGLSNGTTAVIQSPVTNTVDGAMALQEFIDNWEWVSQPGNPVAYAPYLSKDPLPGVDPKSVLIQFAKGDQNIVNPTTTAFLRAGDLANRATYYRHDLAYADNQKNPQNGAMLTNPHTFVVLTTSKNPLVQAIALAAQNQIATFFASNGSKISQPQLPDGFGTLPDPMKYFELLTKDSPLPEGLNFILPPPSPAPTASGGSNNVLTASRNVPDSTTAVSNSSNVGGITAPSSTSVAGSSPLTAADQVFTDLAPILNAATNAYPSGLSPVAALWQQAVALDLQRLDALLSWEAGAMGMTKDTLIRDLVLASKFSPSGV